VGIVLEHAVAHHPDAAMSAGESLAVSKGGDSLDYLSGACPECGSSLEHESGCAVCRACGYSKCA
jgi:ribonucleoside-diphosphate reductase alpha chain